jgi:hypothetical protein
VNTSGDERHRTTPDKATRDSAAPGAAANATVRSGWRGGPLFVDGVATDGKRADVWFSYLPSDRLFVLEVARELHKLGYVCAQQNDLFPETNAPYRNLTPNDARYVIALWTPPAIETPQIKADARTAAYRGALIEIAFRKACPTERFSDDALISFKRNENLASTEQWRELLTRLKPGCGEPHRYVQEVLRQAPGIGMASLAIGGVGAAAFLLAGGSQGSRPQVAQVLVEPETLVAETIYSAPTKRISETPTVDLALELARGGPEKDFISLDQGTDPKGLAPASVPLEKPAPMQRGVQGPEE